MKRIKAKLKTPEEIWELDKRILRKYNAGMKIDWTASLPTDIEAHSILLKRQDEWLSPREPIKLTQDNIKAFICELSPVIQSIWCTGFHEMPVVEVLDRKDFLPRINELEKATNRAFGYDSPLASSPPAMYLFSSHGRLLIPAVYLIRRPKTTMLRYDYSVTNGDFDIQEVPWDRAFLEEVLSEELSHALFRQLRGEWKEGYVESMKAVGEEQESRIGRLNEVLAQYTKERICLERKPKWGLYVVGDKIGVIWSNRFAGADYVCACALLRDYKLGNIALADGMIPEENEVVVDFCQQHPSNKAKQEAFTRGLKR